MEFFATTVEKVSKGIDNNPYLHKAKLHLVETYNTQKTYKFNFGLKTFALIVNIILLGFTIFFPSLCHELDCPFYVFLYPYFYLFPTYILVFLISLVHFYIFLIPASILIVAYSAMSLTNVIISFSECTYDYILKITSLLSIFVTFSLIGSIIFEIYEIIQKRKSNEEVYQSQMDEEDVKIGEKDENEN